MTKQEELPSDLPNPLLLAVLSVFGKSEDIYLDGDDSETLTRTWVEA